MVVDDTVVAGEVASVSASLLLRVTHHQILVRLRDSLRVFAVAGFAQILDAPLHLGLSASHLAVFSATAQPTAVQPVVQPFLLHLLLHVEVEAVLVTLVVVCVVDHEQPLVGPLQDDVARSLAVPRPAVRLLLLALVVPLVVVAVLDAMNELSVALPDVPLVVPPQILLATVLAVQAAREVFSVSNSCERQSRVVLGPILDVLADAIVVFLVSEADQRHVLPLLLLASLAERVALHDFYLCVHWKLLFFWLIFSFWLTAVR